MLKCSGRSRELCSPATNLSSYFSCRLMSTLRFAWLSTIVTSMFVVLLRLRSPQCFERYYHGQLCHSYFRWMDWNIVVPIGSAHIRVVDVRGGIGAGASEVGHVRVDIDKGHPRPSSTGSDAKWSQRQWRRQGGRRRRSNHPSTIEIIFLLIDFVSIQHMISRVMYWQLSYVYIAAEMLAIVISWLVVAIDLDWMADDWFKNDLKCFKKRKAPESFSEEGKEIE
ncbi:hypothetical protein GW17_00036483 [Ensete ventricosum]|nr:hypothetical protein GW17_00036483 [Ensete ventricosum]